MPNPLIKGQNQLKEYWKNLLSEEKQAELIDNERRWSMWLSIKRDALIENGFSRQEALRVIISMLRKPDNNANIYHHGLRDDGE